VTPRTTGSQSFHDQVIAERAKAWSQEPGFLMVHTNPGQEKNASYTVDGEQVYPDLIIEHRDHGWFIEEVETEDSVNERELQQWLKFARLGRPLNLIVPVTSESTARRLIGDAHGVWVRTYTVVGRTVQFN